MKPQENIETFVDTARKFSVLMMTTLGHTGRIDARPMTLLSVEDDGTLWFATQRGSEVLEGMNDKSLISLTGQSSTTYMHLTGIGTMTHDIVKAGELWQESLRPWFPDGANSKDLMLIRVVPQQSSIWDSNISDMASFVWEAAKAVVTGEKVEGLEGRTFINMVEPHASA